MRPDVGTLTTIRAEGRDIPLLTFQSFQEAITAACSDYEVTHGGGKGRSSSFKFEDLQTHTFDEAIKLAQTGWPEGLERVQGFLSRLDVTGRLLKPEIYHDVVGDFGFDMGRLMLGDPECMLALRDTDNPSMHSGQKVLQLVFNMSASCSVPGDIMMRRGCAAMALIDALEQSGRRVEVDVIAQCREFEYRIGAKNPGASMQIDQLAFALIHPSMLRRVGFSLTALCGDAGLRATRSRYGTPRSRPYGDIYIPAMNMNDPAWQSGDSAIAWITTVLQEQGVELENWSK